MNYRPHIIVSTGAQLPKWRHNKRELKKDSLWGCMWLQKSVHLFQLFLSLLFWTLKSKAKKGNQNFFKCVNKNRTWLFMDFMPRAIFHHYANKRKHCQQQLNKIRYSYLFSDFRLFHLLFG